VRIGGHRDKKEDPVTRAATKAVTVLGTGMMGAGMARSLVRAGFDVTVWNRTEAKARALADDGVTVAADPESAVAGADVVVTILFDSDAVSDVMGTALASMRADAVWVQSSTVGIDGVAALAELAGRHGIAYLDAPVLGTRQPAEEGTLTVLVGGPESLRDRVTPVFDAIGARTVWVGEQPGAGQRLKLVANSWVVSLTAAIAQGVALATDLGLDPRDFLALVAGGPLDSPYAQLKGSAMIEQDFTPSFSLSSAAKDAGLILAAMRASGTDPRLMDALLQLFGAADQAGHGDEDMAAVFLGLSGTTKSTLRP
jgi:3-hydroxyisobutyrate dehydrogenase